MGFSGALEAVLPPFAKTGQSQACNRQSQPSETQNEKLYMGRCLSVSVFAKKWDFLVRKVGLANKGQNHYFFFFAS